MISALQGASGSLNILNFKTNGALRNMLPLAISAVLIPLGQLVENRAILSSTWEDRNTSTFSEKWVYTHRDR